MFRCDKCGKVTQSREKLTKKPILIRDRVYQTEVRNEYGKKKTVTSFGFEIVKEINLCESCAQTEN